MVNVLLVLGSASPPALLCLHSSLNELGLNCALLTCRTDIDGVVFCSPSLAPDRLMVLFTSSFLEKKKDQNSYIALIVLINLLMLNGDFKNCALA